MNQSSAGGVILKNSISNNGRYPKDICCRYLLSALNEPRRSENILAQKTVYTHRSTRHVLWLYTAVSRATGPVNVRIVDAHRSTRDALLVRRGPRGFPGSIHASG